MKSRTVLNLTDTFFVLTFCNNSAQVLPNCYIIVFFIHFLVFKNPVILRNGYVMTAWKCVQRSMQYVILWVGMHGREATEVLLANTTCTPTPGTRKDAFFIDSPIVFSLTSTLLLQHSDTSSLCSMLPRERYIEIKQVTIMWNFTLRKVWLEVRGVR